MKIFVAGHLGMVGSAICRQLALREGVELLTRSRQQLDLLNQVSVQDFLSLEKPDAVIIAAAKVGGIHANNTYPADFIYENLMIQNNLIHGSHVAGVNKLLFLGSSCIYPKLAKQPIKEEYLLTGFLEPTNEPYAIAKIAGIKMCESYNRQYKRDYRSVMPTNLFGPGDNFHPENSHVVPALIRRFHEAKVSGKEFVTVWGSGEPCREFLYVDDMAEACLYILDVNKEELSGFINQMSSHINVGYGEDLKVREVAEMIKVVVGYSGDIVFDSDKPDGTPRKLLDSSTLRDMGWSPRVSLFDGLELTYKYYTDEYL